MNFEEVSWGLTWSHFEEEVSLGLAYGGLKTMNFEEVSRGLTWSHLKKRFSATEFGKLTQVLTDILKSVVVTFQGYCQ
ncbi:hypothetical protein Q3G72_033005 [Acer saccharum]|nr:hypothetical protein Q3G72_033005 [Acer saccharum]